MRWHTVERLSPRQSLTPEGYLVVTDTIIARCGDQIYHHSEVPLDPDDDGNVVVSRDATEVFRPEAVASFEGKAITDDHPEVEVTPETHRSLAIGHVQNVRRGEGADHDCLVADLIFTDPKAIEKVRGKRKLALSCGYDARYEPLSRGRGAQRTIVGNHVALVDEGRCGARCTIGDSGQAIFSYLAPKTHDAGCGCDACEAAHGHAGERVAMDTAPPPWTPSLLPAARRRRRGLKLWVDGALLWRAWGRDAEAWENEPRKPGGEAGGGEWTAGGGGGGAGGGHIQWKLPPKPGETPIPAGHIRLYHQTEEKNLGAIKHQGIQLSKAEGIEGPRAIYADPKGFYGKPEDKPTVEFLGAEGALGFAVRAGHQRRSRRHHRRASSVARDRALHRRRSEAAG